MRSTLARLEAWAEAEEALEPGLGSVLREALHEDYLDADQDDEAYDDAVEAMLDSMSAAEGFSFANALRQIQSGAGQVMSNPVVGQVARTALPVSAGALGTVVGGPAGTAIGSKLGTLAAGALGGPAPARPATAPGVTAPPAVAGGSAAATQAMVLTQLPDVLKAMLAVSMGAQGARQVNGVPVASVMNMLSSVFGQAAADADELAYLDGEDDGEWTDPDLGVGRSLYPALIDAENEWLA